MTTALALKNSLEIGSVGTTSMVSTPANSFSGSVKAALEKADAVFVKVKEKVDALETPLEFVTIGLEWAVLVEVLEHHAEPIKNVVGEATAPLVLISLVAKTKKVQKAFFGPQVEGAEAPKASELVSMGFSLCDMIQQRVTLFSHFSSRIGQKVLPYLEEF